MCNNQCSIRINFTPTNQTFTRNLPKKLGIKCKSLDRYSQFLFHILAVGDGNSYIPTFELV